MRNILFCLLLAAFIFTGFNFKQVNLSNKTKTRDSLLVMPPILNLHCINDKEVIYDTVFMNLLDKSITNTYQTLLEKKHVVYTREHKNLKPDKAKLTLLKPLIENLDQAKKKTLKDIKVDPILFDSLSTPADRYLLFTYVEGGYRSKKAVKQKQAVMLPLMITTSILMGRAYPILAGRYSNCILYQYLYDRKENKILLYTKSKKFEGNLWDNEETVQFIKTTSKKLYYR